MNNKNRKRISYVVFSSLLMFAANAFSTENNLEQQILEADKVFFTAFNNCDLAVMGKMFSKDLEFYHDVTGLKGYDATMEATKTNCERNLGLVRTLDKQSHSVFPVRGFGAIQQGHHTFCHIENGKNDCGTFGFTTIWKRTDSGWRMYRVTSYDH